LIIHTTASHITHTQQKSSAHKLQQWFDSTESFAHDSRVTTSIWYNEPQSHQITTTRTTFFWFHKNTMLIKGYKNLLIVPPAGPCLAARRHRAGCRPFPGHASAARPSLAVRRHRAGVASAPGWSGLGGLHAGTERPQRRASRSIGPPCLCSLPLPPVPLPSGRPLQAGTIQIPRGREEREMRIE
jgi:hypothetical protein